MSKLQQIVRGYQEHPLKLAFDSADYFTGYRNFTSYGKSSPWRFTITLCELLLSLTNPRSAGYIIGVGEMLRLGGQAYFTLADYAFDNACKKAGSYLNKK